MSEWFSFSTLSNLANQASKFADEFADSLAAQAAAVQSELASEHLKVQQEVEAQSKLQAAQRSDALLLPWETQEESRMILSQDLMEKILELSLAEKNFLVTPPNIHCMEEFQLTNYVPIIMRLLEIDANLSRMQSKLSLKLNEETFWHNYFFRVQYLRALVGMDDPTPFQMDIYPVDVIIHKSILPAIVVENDNASTSANSSPKHNTAAPVVSDKPSPEVTLSAEAAAALSQHQQQLAVERERERQLEQRRIAEAKLAAAVEAELLDDPAEDYHKSSPVGLDSKSHNKAVTDADLDLDIDLELGDDIDLDDLGDLDLNDDDLDLGDVDDIDGDDMGNLGKGGNISSFEDLAGTSVGGSGASS